MQFSLSVAALVSLAASLAIAAPAPAPAPEPQGRGPTGGFRAVNSAAANPAVATGGSFFDTGNAAQVCNLVFPVGANNHNVCAAEPTLCCPLGSGCIEVTVSFEPLKSHSIKPWVKTNE